MISEMPSPCLAKTCQRCCWMKTLPCKAKGGWLSCLTPLNGLYTSMLSCYSANSSTLQIRMLWCYNCPWIANIKCRNKTQQHKVGTNATMQKSFSIEVTALMHHPCRSASFKKLFQKLLQIPVHATHPIIPPLHVHEIMSKCDICVSIPTSQDPQHSTLCLWEVS